MKDILIALSPDKNPERDICKAILLEAQQYGPAVKQLHNKAFLLIGPKSFEIAMSLSRIAEDGGLKFVVCEVESVLVPSPPDQKDNHQ